MATHIASLISLFLTQVGADALDTARRIEASGAQTVSAYVLWFGYYSTGGYGSGNASHARRVSLVKGFERDGLESFLSPLEVVVKFKGETYSVPAVAPMPVAQPQTLSKEEWFARFVPYARKSSRNLRRVYRIAEKRGWLEEFEAAL